MLLLGGAFSVILGAVIATEDLLYLARLVRDNAMVILAIIAAVKWVWRKASAKMDEKWDGLDKQLATLTKQLNHKLDGLVQTVERLGNEQAAQGNRISALEGFVSALKGDKGTT